MNKRINIAGLRWSIKEIVGIVVGFGAAILLLFYLNTKLEYGYFLSTVAIIVTGIVGLIGALTLKRTIDTVRPFLTLTQTGFLVAESLQEGVMRLYIRNTGTTPAEKISIRLSLSKLQSKATSRELMSQIVNTPTIFPTEERVITYYPRPELLRLIEAEETELTINITYQSAQKKYYTTRTMNILKGKGLDKGKFPFNFIDTRDSWD
jgi:hypothetical protein